MPRKNLVIVWYCVGSQRVGAKTRARKSRASHLGEGGKYGGLGWLDWASLTLTLPRCGLMPTVDLPATSCAGKSFDTLPIWTLHVLVG